MAHGDVVRQLERILAHSLFCRSQRLSAFLRYAVEVTLAGGADTLKEFVIGTEVFKRGDRFDPQTDNIVRVNANRLRSRLAEYYQSGGRSDPLLIEIPRGGYAPVFSYSSKDQQGERYAPVRPAAVTTTVGRDRELEQLRSAFAAVANGTGLMAAVSGDAGVGKTSLVEAFLSEIETRPASAWIGRGRCSERLANTDAFVPVFECLDELTRVESGAEALQIMKAVAPSWVPHLASRTEEPPRIPVREASAERMRREFVRFFEELSSIRTVVLFLDDLHWGDASTCDLLAYLGSRMRHIRLLIITTYRPSGVFGTPPFLPVRLALERSGCCRAILVDCLTLGDVECHVANLFPENAFPKEFFVAVYERTEGHPLFLRDLLGFLADQNILVAGDGQWRMTKDLAEIRSIIPAGTQSMIRLKIEQLGSLDRKILQCAAVQGVEFDSAVVSRALSINPGKVEDRLQTLDRVHRLVQCVSEREYPDGAPSLHYRFAHVLYQNALYADLVPTRRAEHSLAVAQSLIGVTHDPGRAMAAELALLFEAGRDHQRAAEYFLRAARNAAATFAYPETVLLCERGLKALRALPESRERDVRELEFSLTLGMGQMATCGYAAPNVEKTHRRSRELCLRLNEHRYLVRVLWGLHTCMVNSGELVQALELAKEMRQIADASDHPTSIVESLHALGTSLAFLGDLVGAREALERIFTISPVGQQQLRGSSYVLDRCVTSLGMLARVLAQMGCREESLDMAASAVDLANRLSHPPSLAYATFWVGWIHHARGDHAQALGHLEAAMALSRAHALPQILEWARVCRGSSLAHTGRVAEGISEMRISLDNQAAMRCFVERPYCLTLLAEALLRVDGLQEALALCDEALRIAAETGGRSYESETHAIRREVLRRSNAAAGGSGAAAG